MDTRITLNWVDVKDVAEGCFLAAEKDVRVSVIFWQMNNV